MSTLFAGSKCVTENSHASQRGLSSFSEMRMWRVSSPAEHCSCLSVSRDKAIGTHFPRPSAQRGHPHFASALYGPSFLWYTLTFHTAQKAITGREESAAMCECVNAHCKEKQIQFLQVTPHQGFKMSGAVQQNTEYFQSIVTYAVLHKRKVRKKHSLL